jgi:hypothetical protein
MNNLIDHRRQMGDRPSFGIAASFPIIRGVETNFTDRILCSRDQAVKLRDIPHFRSCFPLSIPRKRRGEGTVKGVKIQTETLPAPLARQRVQQARWRSTSLEASGPHWMTEFLSSRLAAVAA